MHTTILGTVMNKNIIGLKLADGTFYSILTRGKRAKKHLQVTTASDSQTVVQINLYAASDESFFNAEYLDTLKIEGLVPHEKLSPTIDMTLTLDDNDVLSAQILDSETGASANITVELLRLGEGELDDGTPVSEATVADADFPLDAEFADLPPIDGLGDDAAFGADGDSDSFGGADDLSIADSPLEDMDFPDTEDAPSDFDAGNGGGFDDDDFAASADVSADDLANLDESLNDDDFPFGSDGADEPFDVAGDVLGTGDADAEPSDADFEDPWATDDEFDQTFDTAFAATAASSAAAIASASSDAASFAGDDLGLDDWDVPTGTGANAGAGGFTNFDFLDEPKRKLPLVPLVCVICALISLLSCFGIWLFTMGARSNEPQIVTEAVPQVRYETVKVISEVSDYPQQLQAAVAQEDRIVIVEAPVVVPSPAAPPPVTVEAKTYQIKWGDTLWDIADTFYKNPWMYDRIARANNIKNPDFILSGTWIIIPAN